MVGSGIFEVTIITVALVVSVMVVYFIMKSVLSVSNDTDESLELPSTKHVYMAVGIWLGTAAVFILLTTVLYMAVHDIDDVYTGIVRLCDVAFLGKPIAFYIVMAAMTLMMYAFGMLLVNDTNALYGIDPSFNFSFIQSLWNKESTDTGLPTEIISPASRMVRALLIMAFILSLCMPGITRIVVMAMISQ